MHKKSLNFLGSTSLLLGLALASTSAHAGFQWVPASGGGGQPTTYQSQMATAPVPRSAPTQSVQRVQPRTTAFDSMPMVQISSEEQPQAEAKAPEHVLVPPAEAQAVAAPAASADAATAPASGAGVLSKMSDKPLKGFANNVPLSVALRQVLPQEYGYSVAPDVNLSTLVSWKGGESWQGTLGKMLRASDLSMEEKGQVIHIVRAKAGANTLVTTETPTRSLVRPVGSMGAAPSLQSLKAGSKPMSLGTLSRDEVGEPDLGAPLSSEPTTSVRTVSSRTTDASAPRDMMVVNSWQANRGETLRKVIDRWSQNSGVEVVWQAEYDYPLQASVSLSGTFEEAVRALLSGFQDAKPQPSAVLHASQSGGAATLVVRARGNNYSE